MVDWYRNTDWNVEIEAAFFDKLSRARLQRDQYIVLQALHLAFSHPEICLKLVDFYFSTRTDNFHDDRARRAASSAHFALGGYAAALDNYLKILQGQDAERDIYVGSPLVFAFLAARYRSTDHYAAALEQLNKMPLPGPNNLEEQFRYHAAKALLLSETGFDPAGSAQEARLALDTPEEVKSAYSDVVWRLRRITRS